MFCKSINSSATTLLSTGQNCLTNLYTCHVNHSITLITAITHFHYPHPLISFKLRLNPSIVIDSSITYKLNLYYFSMKVQFISYGADQFSMNVL